MCSFKLTTHNKLMITLEDLKLSYAAIEAAIIDIFLAQSVMPFNKPLPANIKSTLDRMLSRCQLGIDNIEKILESKDGIKKYSLFFMINLLIKSRKELKNNKNLLAETCSLALVVRATVYMSVHGTDLHSELPN